MLAQLPGDGEAVLAGQAQVEQDQRRQVVTQCVHQRRAAVQLRHPEAVALQVAGQQPGDVDFVVEHGIWVKALTVELSQAGQAGA